jgi:type VI secretion system Hcp family effector
MMNPRTTARNRLLIAFALLTGFAAGAAAQDTSYILIPGIPGESLDTLHPNWIEAYGVSHLSSSSGGAPLHDQVAVLKGTDNSTPPLLDRLSKASNLGTVTIEVCRNPAAGPQECYYRLSLENATVTALNLSGSSCIDPATSCTPAQTESVQFAFTRITWHYTSFSGAKNTCSCWDLSSGKSCSCTP